LNVSDAAAANALAPGAAGLDALRPASMFSADERGSMALPVFPAFAAWLPALIR
jgi:hypothetical protein